MQGHSTTGRKNKSSKQNARRRQSRVLSLPSCTEVDDQRWTAGEEQGWICGKSKSVRGLVPFIVIVICSCDGSPGERGEVTRQMASFIFIGLGTEGQNPNLQSSCCLVVFCRVRAPVGIFTPYHLQREVNSPENTYCSVPNISGGQSGYILGNISSLCCRVPCL